VPLAELLAGLLERAVLSSSVADEPDRARIDRFLIDAYQRAWTSPTA